MADTPTTERAQRCESVSEVKPFGGTTPLRCLLVAPHPFYRHYAAVPADPARFWTWEDKHPEHPCPSVDCPGDARYAPPGRGHYGGCMNRPAPGGCQTCGWVGRHNPKSVACHGAPSTRPHSLSNCWCGQQHAREDFL